MKKPRTDFLNNKDLENSKVFIFFESLVEPWIYFIYIRLFCSIGAFTKYPELCLLTARNNPAATATTSHNQTSAFTLFSAKIAIYMKTVRFTRYNPCQNNFSQISLCLSKRGQLKVLFIKQSHLLELIFHS